ncbi:MAG: GNAT family N-acetyltransferase [Chloroflexi bacterium]|nr:GNAT family N-acetyltransferase [Chloroflexota bacterium]
MDARHYQRPADLCRAQTALMQWVREAGHCNYWHKGDIGHRLFNGCYKYDKAEVFRYWLGAAGEIAAFATLHPHWEVFDLQVAPALRFSDDHIKIFEFCERETLRLAAGFGISFDALAADAFDCDPAYIAFVEARGYTLDKLGFIMTRHDLADLPEAELPAGFRFCEATAADAARLADVHNHSFTNKWNAESYGAVFRSPHMEHEWVVVAPDGRFAAFTNLWIDDLNRSLLFEPVGTHSDFRRKGLAKALMTYALRRMKEERGIECAYVCHQPPEVNPAAVALYASVGFERLHDIYEYKKPVRSIR